MLRAGTTGANPWSRLIDQRDVRVSSTPMFALSDLLSRQTTQGPRRHGCRRGPQEFGVLQSTGFAQGTLFSSQGALLSKFTRSAGPLRLGQIPGRKKPLTSRASGRRRSLEYLGGSIGWAPSPVNFSTEQIFFQTCQTKTIDQSIPPSRYCQPERSGTSRAASRA